MRLTAFAPNLFNIAPPPSSLEIFFTFLHSKKLQRKQTVKKLNYLKCNFNRNTAVAILLENKKTFEMMFNNANHLSYFTTDYSFSLFATNNYTKKTASYKLTLFCKTSSTSRKMLFFLHEGGWPACLGNLTLESGAMHLYHKHLN